MIAPLVFDSVLIDNILYHVQKSVKILHGKLWYVYSKKVFQCFPFQKFYFFMKEHYFLLIYTYKLLLNMS